MIHSHSIIALNISYHDHVNHKTEMSQKYDSNTFVENMAALIVYCNHTQIRHHLLQTYRLIDTKDNIQTMIKRHQQFMHLCLLIINTTSLFSEPSENSQEFYCSIKGNVLLPTSTAHFHTPTSASSNPLIALKSISNEDNTGYILSIKTTNSSTFTDCSWITNFHYEPEILFGSENILTITSIIDSRSGIDRKSCMELPSIFAQSVTKWHHDLTHLFDASCSITKDQYIKKINVSSNDDTFSKDTSFETAAVRSIYKTVKQIHLSGFIKKFYPNSFVKNGQLNFSVIVKAFNNSTHVFVYDCNVDHALYEAMSRAINTAKNPNLYHIEFIGDAEIDEHWQKIFCSMNWVLLTKDKYTMLESKKKLRSHGYPGVILINLNKAKISVKKLNIEKTTPQVYCIEIRIGDEMMVIRKRYSQFRGLKSKLVNAEVINDYDVCLFPEKSLFISDDDVHQRACLLYSFMKIAVERCSEYKRFDILHEFLFVYQCMTRYSISGDYQSYYTFK